MIVYSGNGTESLHAPVELPQLRTLSLLSSPAHSATRTTCTPPCLPPLAPLARRQHASDRALLRVSLQIVDLDAESGELVKVGAFDHHYPATKARLGCRVLVLVFSPRCLPRSLRVTGCVVSARAGAG